MIFLKRDIKKLNKRLETIKSADTNMRLTTETFDKDIVELCNNVNALLDEQRKAAVESEKSNREFRQAITNISHDIRTPLTSAIGYIQMMKSGEISGDKQQEYLDVIEHRLKSLSGLINDLFEYTQIVEGKAAQNIEKVNLCNVLRDIVSVYYGDFMEKKFAVDVSIPDSPVYILCDAGYIRRAVQNLVQNVLAHGTEHFRLSLVGGEIIFQNKVANPETLEPARLFERFYTADLSRSGNTAGLGLAIVKELVRSMGGEVSAALEGDALTVCVKLKI